MKLLPWLLLAFSLTIDQPTATVVVATLVAVSQIYNTWTLNTVHTLVNSAMTEAKNDRKNALAALKTSTDLNIHLQQQLDAARVAPAEAPLHPPTS
jgi:hypothetical protein